MSQAIVDSDVPNNSRYYHVNSPRMPKVANIVTIRNLRFCGEKTHLCRKKSVKNMLKYRDNEVYSMFRK